MNELFQAIRGADLKIYYFLTHFAGNWFLDRLVSHEEDNNLLRGGIFYAMYWYLWFRVDPDTERRRRAIVAIVIGAILAIIAARTVAFITPFRIRPIFDPTVAHPSYSIPVVSNLESWSAFPSDTAAYFFALAFGLAYLSRRLAIPILLYAVGWVCLPRMYFGLHYASDIVVGGAIGIMTVWISLKNDLLQSTVVRRALGVAKTRPQWFYAIAFLLSFEMATVFASLRLTGSAVMHGILIALHLRYRHSSMIDEWEGLGALLAMTGLLLIAAYVAFKLHRTFHKPKGERTTQFK